MEGLSSSLARVADQLIKRAAEEQGGVISGDNPARFNAKDPIPLWVIQVVIIITMTQLLSLVLSRIRQPRVIAEVIGGIILGPTVMGRIPNFRSTIFPDPSMPLLALTANLGVVLFLFLVGLELDTRIIIRNFKTSGLISISGLTVPLGMGAGLGAILYKRFVDPSVHYGHFILFSAVAIAITAFPVLCRILTELKLINNHVGVVVLSAGVVDDVVGWILLALTVALVNASNGLTALYVLLASLGYVLFFLYPVRWAYAWLARRTGSLEAGQPTAFMVTITILLVFVSAFFTDIIGVHAIFGGFLAGLIVPHEGGFAIALVEKFEDLVSILFVPLYFTLSGLRTNLGLLNNGVTWGYTILICLFAFVCKFGACAAAAKYFGFNWRESAAVGSLMSCKGLVELIVLNVGLQAGILDTRLFSMFVVHALVLTFMTTPLVLAFYPESVRNKDHVARDQPKDVVEAGAPDKQRSLEGFKTRFSIVLDRIEQLSAAMTLTQLLQPPSYHSPVTSSGNNSDDEKSTEGAVPPVLAYKEVPMVQPRITINTLRLIEFTVLKLQAGEVLLHSDPVVSIFRTFGNLNRLTISAMLSVVGYSGFPNCIASHARDNGSDMVVLPWSRSVSSSDDHPGATAQTSNAIHNPLEGMFKQPVIQEESTPALYSDFVRKVFASSPCDVALFLDRSIGSSNSGTANQHLFFPFFGGPDDRLALSFVVQLCGNPAVTATVAMMEKVDPGTLNTVSTVDTLKLPPGIASQQQITDGIADTVYGRRDTETNLASETADKLLWNKYTNSLEGHSAFVKAALTRIKFTTKSSAKPLHALLTLAAEEYSVSGRTLVVIVGRSRRTANESHGAELRELVMEKNANVGHELSKTVGDVAAAVIAGGTTMNLLVLQASE